jgi:alkylation response protein AidB-like acyl-CoA dehydrogenase
MLSNSLPGLDFGLGSDLEMLRDTVRDFAQEKIAPRAAAIDSSNSFPRDLWPQLGKLGLLGITVEEEWGGARLSRALRGHGGDFAILGRGRSFLWRAFEPVRQPDPP